MYVSSPLNPNYTMKVGKTFQMGAKCPLCPLAGIFSGSDIMSIPVVNDDLCITAGQFNLLRPN